MPHDATADLVIANLATGERFAQAMADRDAQTLVELIDPEVVWHFPGSDHEIAGEHRGLAEVGAFAAAVAELTSETFRMDVHRVFAGREGAVIAFTGHGSRPDGRVLENPTRLELLIVGGRVTELREFVWDSVDVSAFWR